MRFDRLETLAVVVQMQAVPGTVSCCVPDDPDAERCTLTGEVVQASSDRCSGAEVGAQHMGRWSWVARMVPVDDRREVHEAHVLLFWADMTLGMVVAGEEEVGCC